jgi:phospholipid transport system substrate-binding protein
MKNVLNRLTALSQAMGLVLAMTFASAQALAQEAPDVLVKRASQEVLDAAKNDKDVKVGNSRRVRELVEGKILPYMDFEKTTAMVAGRVWREASPEQKRQLADEFRSLLIHTYSGALSQVKDQRIEFSPLRADPPDTEVEVRSRILQTRGEPITMNYRLTKTADGWKIYDVGILGVWLIETYRNSFAAEVSRGGIDGLIRVLSEKNKRLASNAAGSQKPAG